MFNRIKVYDGQNDKSMLIGEVFGTPKHRIIKSISSSEKSIYIELREKKRVWLNWIGVVDFVASIKYNKINLDCKSWLDTNMLLSPYHPNINCSWLITRKSGSYITLDFIFMEVKSMNMIAKLWYILKFAYC